MKIFSDHLTRGNIIAAAPAGTTVVECEIVYGMGDARKTSLRKRKNCFNVRLSGSGPTCMWHRRDKAATWDEWGHFLAAIFEQDEDAICGNYNGADDFHSQTKYKYEIQRYCRECDGPIYGTGFDIHNSCKRGAA